MAQEGKEEISALLARFPVCVTYAPLPGEVDLGIYVPSNSSMYLIRPRASLVPDEEAQRVIAVADTQTVAVLLPGTRFDMSGTRHGRGGGWYDRFLAACPASWTRIGFCFNDQFSQEPLVRQPWDESVDYVVVTSKDGTDPVLYETEARS